MANTMKSIIRGLLSFAFIIIAAGVIGFIGFVAVVVGIYYTWMLFLNYGLLAGAAAVIGMAIVLIIATHKLIKYIQKG